VASPAVPTPAELTQLQKDINQLSSQVRDSRREVVAQTRGVEVLEAEIRSIEIKLRTLSQAGPAETRPAPAPAAVAEPALRRRRAEIEADIRHCKAEAKVIGQRYPQVRDHARFRDEYLAGTTFRKRESAVKTWLSATAEPAQSGRRKIRTDHDAHVRLQQFFANALGAGGASGASSSTGRAPANAGRPDSLDRLLEALPGDNLAPLRDKIIALTAHWIAQKNEKGDPLAVLVARMPPWRHVVGALAMFDSGQVGRAPLRQLGLNQDNAKVIDAAFAAKAEEFRALLKPPREKPDELLELQGAWELRAKSRRKEIDAITAQLSQVVSVAKPTPVVDKSTPLLAELERLTTSVAGRAEDFARALAEHTQRVSLLDAAKTRLDQGRTDASGARGASQRRSAANAEQRQVAEQAVRQKQDEVWNNIQPALAKAFSPQALKRTLERHLELPEDALRTRLHPQLTRATTYSSRADLLVAVADVLRSAPGGSDAATGTDRLVAHDRQVGHGLRLLRTGDARATMSHASSFQLAQDGRIAHMFPWISPA